MQARVQVRAEVQIAPAASCDCSGYRRADADAVPVWTSLPRRSRLTTALHHGVVASHPGVCRRLDVVASHPGVFATAALQR